MSIKLENISYVYSPGTAYEHHALKDVSLEIPHRDSSSESLDTRVRENQP